jgi:hypothetical protein
VSSELRVEVGAVEHAFVNQALTEEGNIRRFVLAEQSVTVDLAIRVLGIRFRSGESRLVQREGEANPASNVSA